MRIFLENGIQCLTAFICIENVGSYTPRWHSKVVIVFSYFFCFLVT